MNIKDFKQALPYLFKANTTAFIWGHAGIGKSSIIKQYAEEQGYHFFPLYLGTQSDLGDVLGLADFKRDASGTAIATTFATPIWLKDAIDYCNDNPNSGAIIFLDEFNRARRDVLNGMFSLALDKTFHTLKLPANCHIIAAGNPPTDEYFVTDINETALMSRFVHIKLEPSVDEFLTYAKNSKFESSLISFIAEQPELLEDGKSAFDLPVRTDRRSYERVNRLFKAGTPPNLLEQLMFGIIGAERTVAYKLHLKTTSRPLTGAEIIAGNGAELATKWANPEDVASSMLSLSCDNLLEELRARDAAKIALTDSEAKNIVDFLKILPPDMMYAGLSKIVKAELFIFAKIVEDNNNYSAELIGILRRYKGGLK